MAVAHEFLKDKLCSDEQAKKMRLSTSFIGGIGTVVRSPMAAVAGVCRDGGSHRRPRWLSVRMEGRSRVGDGCCCCCSKGKKVDAEWGATRPVVIVGATGTGKTKLSIDAAQALVGEVVNADKIQLDAEQAKKMRLSTSFIGRIGTVVRSPMAAVAGVCRDGGSHRRPRRLSVRMEGRSRVGDGCCCCSCRGKKVDAEWTQSAVAHEFFRLPPEENAKLCSDEPAKKMRLSTSFNVGMETVHNWRDHLRLHHHPLEQFVPDWPANPPPFRLSEGTPLKSSGYGENRHESKMFALVATQSLSPGDGSSSSTGAPVPLLWLDSGAAIHVVGDAEILTNLRDPPTEMAVTVADGSQLPITKVGVIQAPNINIPDVYLAPGLEMNLVSVRQLAKSEIVTTFYENYAELCIKGERIGGAIVDNDVSLYRLCFFKPHA